MSSLGFGTAWEEHEEERSDGRRLVERHLLRRPEPEALQVVKKGLRWARFGFRV